MVRRVPLRSPEAVLRGTQLPEFRQERSRRSYQALLDAATELFAQHGYDAVSTPEIAERAGVAVGTFYRYFDDKREVYLEIMRRTIVIGYGATLEFLTPDRIAGATRHETLERAVDVLFDQVLSHPELTRSFMEMSLRDHSVAE